MTASFVAPATSVDPIGYVLAYVPVALAIIAIVLAFVPAIVLLGLEGLARSRRRPTVAGERAEAGATVGGREGSSAREGEPKPTPA